MKIAVPLAAACLLLACGGDPSSEFDGGGAGPDAAGADDALPPFHASDASTHVDAGTCDPPDMLIVLDRSDSMGASPGKAPDGGVLPSKWTLAVEAVDAITAAPSDGKLRYGLEVLPKAAGACGTGEALVPLDLSAGATIASTLANTPLVYGTPIGGALKVAQATLQSAKTSGRDQYAILVTDGGETCSTTSPLPVVQALAAGNVKTYVVGFGGAVDKALLNDLACAGMTATSFKTSCKKASAGYVSAGGTTPLFFSAQDGATLKTALSTITGGVCCGCTVN
ncbi:MAG TPA: vWA domain-containing protein [Polyangiaceae bacterium]